MEDNFFSITDLLLSPPALIVMLILFLIGCVAAWPIISDAIQSHMIPYRSSIPGMARAAFLYDLLAVVVIVSVAALIWG